MAAAPRGSCGHLLTRLYKRSVVIYYFFLKARVD
jgi:hypothetical protein